MTEEKFYEGDTVTISEEHPAVEWRGLTGTITKVHAKRDAFDQMFIVETDKLGTGGFFAKYLTPAKTPVFVPKFHVGQKVKYIGNGDGIHHTFRDLIYTVQSYSNSGKPNVHLKSDTMSILIAEADLEAVNTEGMEIRHDEVTEGMEIAVSRSSTFSGVTTTTTRQGVVHYITPSGSFYGDGGKGNDPIISFNKPWDEQKIILVKDVPYVDETTKLVRTLGPGSVVQYRNGFGAIHTYVNRGTLIDGNTLWTGIQGIDVVKKTEADIVSLLKTGAEAVHTVPKETVRVR